MLRYLLDENSANAGMKIPDDPQAQKDQLRALMNDWLPHPLDAEFLQIQDACFRKETKLRGRQKSPLLTTCPAIMSCTPFARLSQDN